MNNLSFNRGLVDAKMRASDKDLPVRKSHEFLVKFQNEGGEENQTKTRRNDMEHISRMISLKMMSCYVNLPLFDLSTLKVSYPIL